MPANYSSGGGGSRAKNDTQQQGGGRGPVNARNARREAAMAAILAAMQGAFGDYIRDQVNPQGAEIGQAAMAQAPQPGPSGMAGVPGGGFMGAGAPAGPLQGVPGGGFMGAGAPAGPPQGIPGGGFMGAGQTGPTGNPLLDAILQLQGGQMPPPPMPGVGPQR